MDDSFVPEYGFVNMELLEVLAPNHFSVRVIGHKRKLQHKSKPIENYELEWKQFKRSLRVFYSLEGSLEQPDGIRIGQMYLYFHQNRPKRCRVVNQSKKIIQIYLIDDGKMHQCSEQELYSLDFEFEDYPPHATELFVLGYAPNDNNTKWLPEAKQFVEHMMNSLKERDQNEGYLQAEIIRRFDRRLIVQDLKILYKVKDQLKGKFIGRSLIQFRLAKRVPIVLHEIFMETPNSSQIEPESYTESHDETGTTDQNDTACMQSNTTQSDSNQRVAAQSISPSAVNIWNDLNSISQLNSNNSNSQTLNIPVASANSNVSLIDIEQQQDSSEAAFGLDQIQSIQSTVATSTTIDEIFGSLPENIQAAKVLLPIKCDSIEIDEIDHGAQEQENQENWLIKFSDSDDEDSKIEPSPFDYVRLINSYDDL